MGRRIPSDLAEETDYLAVNRLTRGDHRQRAPLERYVQPDLVAQARAMMLALQIRLDQERKARDADTDR